MFLHLSLILFTGGWQTPPESIHTTPGAVHAGKYGQQAGGTHPTGMHTCYNMFLF